MRGTAELIPDCGEAAIGDGFFSSCHYYEASGVSDTLRIETDQGELLAPLVTSLIGEGPARDAVSPYGFAGFSGDPGIEIHPSEIDFSPTGLVSAFIRHRLDYVPLLSAKQGNVVFVANPARPIQSRTTDKRRSERNREAGYEVMIVPGPETSADQRSAFRGMYEETMDLHEAKRHYYFSESYFNGVLDCEHTWLALADDGAGFVAGSLITHSDGFLHYFLTGSVTDRRRESPNKNVLAALIEMSKTLNVPLHIGGGKEEGDSLADFKEGFGNTALPWYASELTCDQDAYAVLSGDSGGGDFFPAYRAAGRR